MYINVYKCISNLIYLQILHNSENLSCPICLHPPVAGKMTRCGHVYCWPCILRYLRYCQETGNYKCPICDEYLHKNDLKR